MIPHHNGELPKVVCAAVKLDEEIFLGARHYDDRMLHSIYKVFSDAEVDDLVRDEKELHGFIDATGEFLDRAEARERAFATGQITETIAADCLFSEDLY